MGRVGGSEMRSLTFYGKLKKQYEFLTDKMKMAQT